MVFGIARGKANNILHVSLPEKFNGKIAFALKVRS